MELFEGLRTFGFTTIALLLFGTVLAVAMIGFDQKMRNKKAGLKDTCADLSESHAVHDRAQMHYLESHSIAEFCSRR